MVPEHVEAVMGYLPDVAVSLQLLGNAVQVNELRGLDTSSGIRATSHVPKCRKLSVALCEQESGR